MLMDCSDLDSYQIEFVQWNKITSLDRIIHNNYSRLSVNSVKCSEDVVTEHLRVDGYGYLCPVPSSCGTTPGDVPT